MGRAFRSRSRVRSAVASSNIVVSLPCFCGKMFACDDLVGTDISFSVTSRLTAMVGLGLPHLLGRCVWSGCDFVASALLGVGGDSIESTAATWLLSAFEWPTGLMWAISSNSSG